MKEKSISIWKKKLEWIVEKGGMALLNTHPDYMCFNKNDLRYDTYPVDYYREFLEHIRSEYRNLFWHETPENVALYYRETIGQLVNKAKRQINAVWDTMHFPSKGYEKSPLWNSAQLFEKEYGNFKKSHM